MDENNNKAQALVAAGLTGDGRDPDDTLGPAEMEAPITQTAPAQALPPVGASARSMPPAEIAQKSVDDVLYSDIGITVLLNRLKQSIASARDFATFLKKRATLEEDHAQGLKKLNKSTLDNVRRQESRQGSYALQLADLTRSHDRMADQGMQFSTSLLQMHEDLNELSNNMDRGRKHWKQEGTNNEKKVKDAESALEKAKARYDSLAEDYDRARTGDKSSGRVFTVKGPKSAEKHEEDVLRKLQAADADYAGRVQTAQVQRGENLSSSRPQALKAIQELIRECDAGLTLQLQKFAAFNEKLLVSNGLIVSPLSDGTTGTAAGPRSMRQTIHSIDNDRDFRTFVAGHTSQLPARPMEIRYEKHPTLASSQQSPIASKRLSQTPQSTQAPPTFTVTSAQHAPQLSSGGVVPNLAATQTSIPGERPPATLYTVPQDVAPSTNQAFRSVPTQQQSIPPAVSLPLSGPASQEPVPQGAGLNGQHSSAGVAFNSRPAGQTQFGMGRTNGAYPSKDLSPSKPVFGVSLDALFRRDETAVPMVVYQCIQAVDLFGLEVEGIYRLSGNANHINQLKSIFDNDASRVDFRNPENFHHDVNSVAGLLKQFFRELPDPLLTAQHYGAFIDAARIEEDTLRRDSLHAVINSLPDPNYATLRAVILHLSRVREHSQANRMSSSNLAICFAPTIMGPHTGPHMADAGLQARVVDTILQNTYQIFDED